MSSANLYEVYSEFSSMIVIAKSDGAYVANLEQKMEKFINENTRTDVKLENSDMKDFSVPLYIFRQYASPMKNLNQEA